MNASTGLSDLFARRRRAAGPALIALAFVLLCVWSWRKWPDVLVDFGHELYTPWMLSRGAMLNRDVATIYGPLSQYFNAALFGAFGVSLTTLIFANLAILAGVTILVYRFFLECCDRFTATLACLVLLGIFAFSQYEVTGNSNFVCPYAHETTHGIALAILMIFLLRRHADLPRIPHAAAAGLCLGAVLLTKPEASVAALAAAGVALASPFFLKPPIPARKSILAAIALAGAAAIPAAAFFLFLQTRVPAGDAFRTVAGAWLPLLHGEVTGNVYFRHIAGMDAPLRNFGWMVAATAAPLALLAIAMLPDRGRFRIFGPPKFACWIGLGLFAALGALSDAVPWLELARALPLIAGGGALGMAVGFWKRRNQPAEASRRAALLGWCVFSLVLLGKMFLHSRVYHYGFYLAMPAALAGVALFTGTLPEMLKARGGSGAWCRALFTGAIVAAIVFHLQTANRIYRQKDFRVASGGDTIVSYSPDRHASGQAAAYALEFIRTQMPPGSTLACLPDGSMLNYLGRKANPSPYLYLMATDFAIFGGEDAVLRSYQKTPPDFLFLIHKRTDEYGVGFFGADPVYGARFLKWIETAYEPVGLIGHEPLRDGRFGIKIFKRRH